MCSAGDWFLSIILAIMMLIVGFFVILLPANYLAGSDVIIHSSGIEIWRGNDVCVTVKYNNLNPHDYTARITTRHGYCCMLTSKKFEMKNVTMREID